MAPSATGMALSNSNSPTPPFHQTLSKAQGDQAPRYSENTVPPQSTLPVRNHTARKPVPQPTNGAGRFQGAAAMAVQIEAPSNSFPHEASSAQIESMPPDGQWRDSNDSTLQRMENRSLPPLPKAVDEPWPIRATPSHEELSPRALSPLQPPSPAILAGERRLLSRSSSPRIQYTAADNTDTMESPETQSSLQYHHQQPLPKPSHARAAQDTTRSSVTNSPPSSNSEDLVEGAPRRRLTPLGLNGFHSSSARPSSAYSNLSMGIDRHSPSNLRAVSANSSEGRPISYVDLLNVPYPQQAPTAVNFNNSHLRGAVGSNASLLSSKQTLEMYRINAKKTNDPAIQYEFAIFMITAAQEAAAAAAANGALLPQGDRDLDSPHVNNGPSVASITELLKEGKIILQKLSDRGYPFAQYYLADGYASGLFNKGKEDWDRAFPLFVSAAKHGHAESCYRAALCYEYGWGCRKDLAKAESFYRQAAARSHPGAMTRLGKACLLGDLGLFNRQREGLKWLRRASEAADVQYNNAPYELGLLHEAGYLDYVFIDEAYAAQLFTQAADLGNVEAAYRLGDSYEHGKLSLPQDGGLSIHFYNAAAEKGHAHSMLALCAWYLVGAEPVIQKDENEAYEWAKAAAEQGLAKAQYTVGYFTESGIGCRPDPLEANVWYVKAADEGDQRAIQRIAAIRAAASGEEPLVPKGRAAKTGTSAKGTEVLTKPQVSKDEKDCIVM